jgi:acetoacetate decarboxylase
MPAPPRAERDLPRINARSAKRPSRCPCPRRWNGPGALPFMPHALAPVAELPILEIVSAQHIFADLALGLGKVVHDCRR